MPGMGRAMVSRGVRRSALCCFFGLVAGLSLCERAVSLPIISTYRTMRRHQNFILADKRLEFDGLQPVKVFYLFFFLTDCLATCWIHHQLPFIFYFIFIFETNKPGLEGDLRSLWLKTRSARLPTGLTS
jgi:hypothetical protein